MSEFAKFFNQKDNLQEKRNDERAPKTLEIYHLIEDMLQNPDYDDKQTFLYSVQQYIEQHSYVSDKQIEIVERIYRHPNE